MDSVRRRVREERIELFTRGKPAKGTHRAVVGAILVHSELCTKIGEGSEAVRIVKAPLVLAVTALDLAVMPRGIGPDELMPDIELLCRLFEERWDIPLAVGETVGKLKAVVGLDAFYRHATALEPGDCLLQEVCGGIGTLLRVSTEIA